MRRMQGDDEGKEYGMGAGESEARCRAWAANGMDVATGSIVFLLLQK